MLMILLASLLDQVLTGSSGVETGMTMFRSAAEFFYIASTVIQ